LPYSPGKAALKTGSCAAEACEPRQVREEAAVSRILWVTQGSLVGAGWPGYVVKVAAKEGARPFILSLLRRAEGARLICYLQPRQREEIALSGSPAKGRSSLLAVRPLENRP